MEMFELYVDETVAVVSMNNGENRFNPTFIQAFLEILDHVEGETAATGLIVRSSHEKIFSNGLDLDWLVPLYRRGRHGAVSDFFQALNRLLKRILLYPLVTIAAVNGHAFAAGAIFTCAFDFRFMRTQRGFFCLPEIDLGMPFFPGMLALLKKAIPLYKLEELQFTARRLTAEECAAHHIVAKACLPDRLMEETLAFAKSLNKPRGIVAEMKQRLHQDIIAVMDTRDTTYIQSAKLDY